MGLLSRFKKRRIPRGGTSPTFKLKERVIKPARGNPTKRLKETNRSKAIKFLDNVDITRPKGAANLERGMAKIDNTFAKLDKTMTKIDRALPGMGKNHDFIGKPRKSKGNAYGF